VQPGGPSRHPSAPPPCGRRNHHPAITLRSLPGSRLNRLLLVARIVSTNIVDKETIFHYFFLMSKVHAAPAFVSDLKSHIGFWMRLVSNHVSHAFARKLLKSGVTVAEWVVLREVYGRNDMSPSKVAALPGMTRGAASKLIDRLFEKRLILREGRN